MSPDKSLQNLFNAALERPDAAERARFLDEACGTDAALRERVEKLLRAQEEVGAFMAQPSRKPAGFDLNQTGPAGLPLTEKPGDRIGRYKLLQQIGEGGCGVVYMAEQEEPVHRRVALKVIKLGMDTKQVIARFGAERQALALMDHPNIAKVLDAGATDTGRPFFVMELVRGTKLTEFCDENNLSTVERLKLFIQVCHAIQHAHQKGVIHRDIKPSNILVTTNDGVPVPKVIDFGIAKATAGRLTDQTLFTAFEQFIGTPAYMSPEQAVMTSLDIDTRGDIYSLGVLLYELLTGSPPFDQKELLAAGLDEMRRTIREVEPVKPSTRLTQELVAAPRQSAADSAAENGGALPRRRYGQIQELIHLLRGDLDWIVMKCLEKDRARRYETANGLAMDVERHLNCQPVMARPPSRLYEFHKTVKRHKFGFTTAGLVLVALLAGMAGTIWGMIRTEKARQDAVSAKFAEAERAEGERRAREEAQTRLVQIEKWTDLLASLLRDLDPMAAKAKGVTSRDLLSRRLGEVAQQLEGEGVGDPLTVARLQHVLGSSLRELGHLEQAEELLVKACQTRERLLGADHVDTVATKHDLASAYHYQQKLDLAEPLYKQVLASSTSRQGADNRTVFYIRYDLANLYRDMKRFDQAIPLLEEVFKWSTIDQHPRKLKFQADLGACYCDAGRFADGIPLLEEVLRNGSQDPQLAWVSNALLTAYVNARKTKETVALVAERIRAAREQYPADSLDLSAALAPIGQALHEVRAYTNAEPLYQEVLSNRAARLGADHPDTISSRDGLAMLYGSMKKPGQSIPLLEESLKLRRAQLDPDHPEILGREVTLGACYCEAGRFTEGIALIEKVRQLGRQDPHPAWVRSALLTAYVQAGKTTEAIVLVTERVQDSRDEFPAGSPELAAALAENGKVLLDAKAYAAAEPLLLTGFEGLRQVEVQVPPQVDRRLLDARERLVQLYDAWGKPDEAAKWRKEMQAAARPAGWPEKPKVQ